MNKKVVFCLIGLIILGIGVFLFTKDKETVIETNKIEALVLSNENGILTIQDSNNVIYKFKNEDVTFTVGDSIVLEYSGLLDKNKSIQDAEVISYKVNNKISNDIKDSNNDNGIFSTYYLLAKNKLDELSLDEKIGQILLVRYYDNALNDLNKYNFGGFVFFAKDFKNKTKDEVISMINKLQEKSKIPLLTAVDEEGGNVVRVSSNPNLRSEPFKSPSQLYEEGGIDLIKQDTKEKSDLLKSLGLNVNLAPVVDVSTSPDDYMYQRSLQKDTNITSEYAKAVIEASKNTGVSYTLKHFPGYGNNADTHQSKVTDSRSLEDIKTTDLPPFIAGINAKAEAILVSHNIVSSIDPSNPASLSVGVHNLLRDDLKFTGIIMTDDISMGALTDLENTTVNAILAGNDLIITTDYEKSINEIKTALNENKISEAQIDKLAFRVLAWKYYKGLMIENNK